MLAQIQDYLRLAASRDRIAEHIGSFLATINPDNPNPYLNYAIPDANISPSASDVRSLIDFYKRHHRKPRLEYIPDTVFDVESVLLEQGFTVEGRLPLMLYKADQLPTVSLPEGIELLSPQSDDEIKDTIMAQNEAYGDDHEVSAKAIEKRRAFMTAGGICVLAREISSGEAVGSGVCDVPYNNVTELAAIGVRTPYRRRGIAGAMSAWLTDQALQARTTTVFLMAMGEAEARIYTSIGFRSVANVLHISIRS